MPVGAENGTVPFQRQCKLESVEENIFPKFVCALRQRLVINLSIDFAAHGNHGSAVPFQGWAISIGERIALE
jgi:hypothetical protein